MGKVIKFPKMHEERNREWNKGYNDGYRDLPCQANMSDVYYTGFEVGKDDREEDEEAMRTGDFDGLTCSERELIYGDESDQP